MATQQRSRSRRSSTSRSRGPRHVEAVLDPTWQNPYTPSASERLAHAHALRRYVLRRKSFEMVAGAVVVAASLVGVLWSPWTLVLALVVAALVVADLRRSLVTIENRGTQLASRMQATFSPGGDTKDRQRLLTVIDRLSATFGVDAVSAFIIDDPGYNAALVPSGAGYNIFVTNALMADFELIELEGVVAHCLARQRMGALARQCAEACSTASPATRRQLAGPGLAYRADEIAAAAIRYPLGIAGALRRCAQQSLAPTSFFASAAFDQWRFVWFDPYRDRPTHDLGDLDNVELRARALEEW
jgi:hypothetical protein